MKIIGKGKNKTSQISWLNSQFAKWALVVYRVGLGSLIAGRVLILTTRGRKSGRLIRTPLWYVREGEVIYCLSRRGLSSQWLKNLRSTPGAEISIGNRRFQVQMILISESNQQDRVTEVFLQTYGRLGKLILNRDRLSLVAFTLLVDG